MASVTVGAPGPAYSPVYCVEPRFGGNPESTVSKRTVAVSGVARAVESAPAV